MSRALYPFCPTCNAEREISRAVVAPAENGVHDVQTYELECGHELEPNARIESGVVDLLRANRPETIEIADEPNAEIPNDD